MSEGATKKYRPKTLKGGRPFGAKIKPRPKGFRRSLSILGTEINFVQDLYRRTTSLEPEGPEFEEWVATRAKYLLMAEARGELPVAESPTKGVPIFNYGKECEDLYSKLDFVLEMAAKNGVLSAIGVLRNSQGNGEIRTALQAIKCLEVLLKDLEISDGWGVI